MATVRRGPAPWHLREGIQGFLPEDFKRRGRFKKPKGQVLVDSADGNKYTIGDEKSLDDLIQFVALDKEFSEQYANGRGRLKDVNTIADFIDFAFNKSEVNAKYRHTVQCPQGSHIAQIEYNERYQLLRVSFENNGSVVVYAKVPYTLFAKLQAYAESGAKSIGADGELRHLVGIEFWNMVRIRGTVHGNRYPTVYEKNMGTGPGYGYHSEARMSRLSDVSHLMGKKGRTLSDEALKEAVREAEVNPYKPLDFLYRKERLTPSEIAEFRKKAADLSEQKGTVAYELTHGNEGDKKARAEAVAQEMVKNVIGSYILSESMKNTLKVMGTEQPGDAPGEGFIRQERYLVRLGLWPREK